MKTFCPSCGERLESDGSNAWRRDPATGTLYCAKCVVELCLPDKHPWPARYCLACGDQLPPDLSEIDILLGRQYCIECGAEKRFGKIGPPPESAQEAVRHHAEEVRHHAEEMSPWQELAIRILEG